MTFKSESTQTPIAAGRLRLRASAAVAPPVERVDAVDISRLFARHAIASPPAAQKLERAQSPSQPMLTGIAVTGSFLAELEREATHRQVREEPDPQVLGRNARLANAACRATTDYWTRLVEHLNVLRPEAPGRYVFDGRTVLEHATAQAFRIAPKIRVAHNGDQHFESVTLGWRVGNGQRLRMVKDFPAEIERLKARLSFAGIKAFESPLRHQDTGRLLGTQFEFTAEVVASVRITPMHEHGKIRLSMQNIDGLERIEAELPAFAIRANELDELARWICGKPQTLLKHAQAITRHDP